MEVLFDTGSPELAAFAVDNDYCGSTCENGVYDASDSSTGGLSNRTAHATYADFDMFSGVYVTDDVTIGGITSHAGFIYSDKVGQNNVGVLGLGFYSGKKSFIDYLVETGLIARKVISTYHFGNYGALVLGGIDKAKISGHLQFLW